MYLFGLYESKDCRLGLFGMILHLLAAIYQHNYLLTTEKISPCTSRSVADVLASTRQRTDHKHVEDKTQNRDASDVSERFRRPSVLSFTFLHTWTEHAVRLELFSRLGLSSHVWTFHRSHDSGSIPAVWERLSVFLARRQRIIRHCAWEKVFPTSGWLI